MKTNNKLLIVSLICLMALSGSDGVMAFSSPEANVLYQQACSAEYKNDYDTVVAKIKEALNITGDDVTLYTKLAGAYSELGKFDEALEVYKKVSEMKPNDAFIYISIGSIYESKGDFKNALAAYNKSMELFPDYKYNYLNIANAQVQLKEYKSAIESYNRFLDIYSQHIEAREGLAGAYLADNQPQKASEEYEAIYNSNPDDFKDFMNYGLALYEGKKYDKASTFLEKAVANDSENLAARAVLAKAYVETDRDSLALGQYEEIFKQNPNLNELRFDYANLLADMGKTNEAIVQYNKFIAIYPNSSEAYKNLGIVYKKVGNIDLAIANLEKAVNKNSSDVAIKKDLAQCYHLKKDYKNAIKYYNEILQANPNDYTVKYNKAIAYHAMNDYNQAIALYEELLKVKSNRDVKNNLNSALLTQGKKSLESGNYTLAVEYFNKAVKYGTTDGYVYYGLAKCYRANKDTEKACNFYEKAISASPQNSQYSSEYAQYIAEINGGGINAQIQETLPNGEFMPISIPNDGTSLDSADVEKREQLLNSANQNFEAKNYDLAIEGYKEALKIQPSDNITLLKIGDAYKLKNDTHSAISFYKKSVFVNPGFSQGWFNLGLAYASIENYAGAKQSFYRAINIDPTYSYAYYALAVAYEKEGNKSEAIKNYKLFLNYNSDEATANQVKEAISKLEG